MTLLVLVLWPLSCIATFLWGFDLSRRLTAWIVKELRATLDRESARADFVTLANRMVDATELQAKRLEKLDVSVANLVARTFTQKVTVRERQIGEPGTNDPMDFPDPSEPIRRMYHPDGFVEIEGKQIPSAASETTARALGKPT